MSGMIGAIDTLANLSASSIVPKLVSRYFRSSVSSDLASFHGVRLSAYLLIARMNEKVSSSPVLNRYVPKLSINVVLVLSH